MKREAPKIRAVTVNEETLQVLLTQHGNAEKFLDSWFSEGRKPVPTEPVNFNTVFGE